MTQQPNWKVYRYGSAFRVEIPGRDELVTLHLVDEDTGGIDFRYRNLARDITGGF